MPNFVTNTSHKSKKVALLCCLLGGIFGLHYFYVGRYFRGLVVLFTANFFLFGWFSDLWKIVRGRFTDQYGEFLKV